MMRSFFAFFVCTLFIFCLSTIGNAQSLPFTINLSLGSSGMQVAELQKILNRDPDTRIASTGPGSPGNETYFFGLLTKAAVVRFQNKYFSQVLSPAGLSVGNGFVGFYTRAQLNVLANGQTGPVQQVTPPVNSTPLQETTVNANTKKLNAFLDAIDSVGADQNISRTTLTTIKKQVIKDAATSTDLTATFLKLIETNAVQTYEDKSFLGRTLASIGETFRVPTARAAIGTPFGGPLLFAFPCSCSGNWLLTLGPLAPTYVVLLSYTTGSQLYRSYNIPATSWLLGQYYSGAGVCKVFVGTGCISLPSQGLIAPIVGSSPL
jgi:peptidoglycan hydrolase-like protein with peptidoglycan-binding domain